MQLYLCEKPSQAEAFRDALNIKDKNKSKGYFEGNNIIITWGYGHLLELKNPDDYNPELKAWKMETLPIIPKWELKIKESAKKQYNVVKGLLKNASEVIVATDPDREGEVIGVSILEQENYKGKRSRVLSSALDAIALKEAISKIVSADNTYSLYQAGLGRLRADWLIGINITRAMSVINKGKIEGVMSTGRVQTPTLSLVVNRDLEIENFKPKDYFDLTALFTKDEDSFKGKWIIPKEYLDEIEEKCLDKTIVQKIKEKIEGKNGIITKSEKKRKKEKAPLPFSLSYLQKECSSKYGFPADKVLEIAQSLYETHKLTTYPRTDCRYLPQSQIPEIPQVLSAIQKTASGDKEIDSIIEQCNQKIRTEVWNDKKVNESSHHAIIPTRTPNNLSKLNQEEFKVYDLIRRHYLAQFLPEAENDATVLEVTIEDEIFKATGTVPVSPGWKIAFNDKSSSSEELPLISQGSEVNASEINIEDKKTKPPARFNDGSLIDAMLNASKFTTNSEIKKLLKEEDGIGTEATRANIIKTLFDRNYLERKGKQIISTPKGRALIGHVPKVLTDVGTTALWEKELKKVEKKEIKLEVFLEQQERVMMSMLDDIRAGKCTIKESVDAKYKCPNCNSGLKRLKSKKSGKHFWVCLNQDECKTIIPDNRGKPAKPIEQGDTEHFCTHCEEKAKLIRKKGQYGYYWQCSNRECNTFYNDDDCNPVEKQKFTTEEVDQGDKDYFCECKDKTKLIRKKGKFGYYWNCTSCNKNYKDSNTTPLIIKKPTSDYKCPNCKEGYLVERKGKNGVFWGCNAFPKCKTIINDDGGKPLGF